MTKPFSPRCHNWEQYIQTIQCIPVSIRNAKRLPGFERLYTEHFFSKYRCVIECIEGITFYWRLLQTTVHLLSCLWSTSVFCWACLCALRVKVGLGVFSLAGEHPSTLTEWSTGVIGTLYMLHYCLACTRISILLSPLGVLSVHDMCHSIDNI